MEGFRRITTRAEFNEVFERGEIIVSREINGPRFTIICGQTHDQWPVCTFTLDEMTGMSDIEIGDTEYDEGEMLKPFFSTYEFYVDER